MARVRKPMHVCPVPGCAQESKNRDIGAAILLAQLKVAKTKFSSMSDYIEHYSLKKLVRRMENKSPQGFLDFGATNTRAEV